MVLWGDDCVGVRSMTQELFGESQYCVVHCTSKTKTVVRKNFFCYMLVKKLVHFYRSNPHKTKYMGTSPEGKTNAVIQANCRYELLAGASRFQDIGKRQKLKL